MEKKKKKGWWVGLLIGSCSGSLNIDLCAKVLLKVECMQLFELHDVKQKNQSVRMIFAKQAHFMRWWTVPHIPMFFCCASSYYDFLSVLWKQNVAEYVNAIIVLCVVGF